MIPSTGSVLQQDVEKRVELSNQDIEILNEIVDYASVIPETTPWNALFKAYDTILKARHIDPRQDDRCFRFLMRMAEVDVGTWSEKFFILLQRWGYELPVDQPESSVIQHQPWDDLESGIQQALPSSNSSDSSEEEAYDSSSTGDNRFRRTGSTPLSAMDSFQLSARKQKREYDQRVREEERKLQERMRAKREFAFPVDIVLGQSRPGPVIYSSSIAQSDIDHEAEHITQIIEMDEHNNIEVDSDEDIPYDFEAVELPPIRSQADHIRATANAVELYNLRIQHSLLNILDNWRALTAKISKYHNMQHQLALAQDRRTLLSQTLEIWRERSYWRIMENITERDRKVNDAKTMLKIWISKTRTVIQRRQRVNDGILLRKWFVAWRQHTVETEKKIKMIRLRSALRLLRDGRARFEATSNQAQDVYENNLRYRAYWTWYYHYCGSRAPLWYEGQLKNKALLTLCEKAQRWSTDTVKARRFCQQRLKKSYLLLLRSRLVMHQSRETGATGHRNQTLLHHHFRFWRKSAQLAPAADQVEDTVNDRVLYNFISIWRTRLRQQRAAAQIRKVRLLRSTFRNWNLQLRRRIFESNIMERRKSQFLYKIVVQWRYNLFQRMYEARLLSSSMVVLQDKLIGVKSVVGEMEQVAFDFYASRRQTTILRSWRDRLVMVKDQILRANQAQRQKILHQYMDTLKAEYSHTQDLNNWAQSAFYFIETKKCIIRWKARVKSQKRSNRRTAYNQVVKKQQDNLKRVALHALLRQVQTIQDNNIMLDKMTSYKTQQWTSVLLSSWRQRVHRNHLAHNLAEDIYQAHLSKIAFTGLRARQAHIDELYTLADIHYSVVRKDHATIIIKRWNMLLFTYRMNDVKANSFHNRMLQNRRRTYFRSWKEAVVNKRDERAIQEQLQRQQMLRDEADQSRMTYDDEGDDDGRFSRLSDELNMLKIDRWIETPAPLPLASISEAPTQLSSRTILLPSRQNFPKTPSGRAARAKALMQSSELAVQSFPSHRPAPWEAVNLNSMMKASTSTTTPQGSPFLSRGSSFRKKSAAATTMTTTLTTRKTTAKDLAFSQSRMFMQSGSLPALKMNKTGRFQSHFGSDDGSGGRRLDFGKSVPARWSNVEYTASKLSPRSNDLGTEEEIGGSTTAVMTNES